MKIGEKITLEGWEAECVCIEKSPRHLFVIFKNIEDSVIKVAVYIGTDIDKEKDPRTFVPIKYEDLLEELNQYTKNQKAILNGEFDSLVEQELEKFKLKK